MATDVRTGGDAVAECLLEGGVSHTFGVPGEQWLGILDAVGRRENLTFVSTRHEGGASNMAEAFGKLTGRPAVVFGTAGVGAAHLSIGVHTSKQDSTPLVAIVGQVATRLRDRDAWQEINVTSVFEDLSKHTVEIREVERIPELLQRAIDISVSGRPGPVVVSIPEDLQTQACDAPVRTRTVTRHGTLDDALCGAIVDAVNAAERPLVVVGGGVRSSGAVSELADFATMTGLPVVQGWRRSDSFPQDHPSYLGQLGLGTLPGAFETALEADLLLVIGTRLPQNTTHGYRFPTPDQRVIHLDVSDDSLVNQPFHAELAVAVDAGEAVRALTATSGWDVGADALDWSRRRREQFLSQKAADLDSRPAGPAKLVRAAQILDRMLPDDAIVTGDAGDFSGPFAVHLQFRGNRRYLGPTSGSMAYGLSAAVGAKSASPHLPVVAVTGDGGFMMAVQELETAVRYELPIIAIVCNNNLHGSIARHQRARFGGRLVGTVLGNPDFPAMARSFGAKGFRVESDADFEAAMTEALDSDVPCVVEIVM